MARQKSAVNTPPQATSVVVAEPTLDKAAIRQAKFKALVAERHGEKVHTAPAPTVPQSTVPTQSPAEKRAAEEKARQEAILAGLNAKPQVNIDLAAMFMARVEAALANGVKLPEKRTPSTVAQEFFAQPTVGLTGQKLAPKTNSDYDVLAGYLREDMASGDLSQTDARMILRAFADGSLPFNMAKNADVEVVTDYLRTHVKSEATQDSVAFAKAAKADDRFIGYITSQTGADYRPSEAAIRYRVRLDDGHDIEGWVEPNPGESHAAVSKRAETVVVNYLLTPPSGTLVSSVQKSAPQGPYGDLGLSPDGMSARNAVRTNPESRALTPLWGQVMTADGWSERVTRQQILAVRVKGASDLDVGRKTRIGGKMATTTPSKPRPLSERSMKVQQTRCVDVRSCSAPPRGVKLSRER
ncbi:MAG: hypothetical protein WCK05_10425 [Planctomycetota bacterium]